MRQEEINKMADQLHDSERNRKQIKQVSLQYPAMTLEHSYAIQKAWVMKKIEEGQLVRGHKVGLTSRAMQVSSNIDEPDFGVLLDNMFYEDGAALPSSRFIVPRVEVELAFILKKDIKGPSVLLSEVLAATDYVMPALEIIDARFHQVDPQTQVTRKVFDTIADNAANAAVVLGGTAFRPDSIDLRWLGAGLLRNGIIEETGLAFGVLNHPGNGVAWLANKLSQVGDYLKAGQVILSGSFTRPVNASAGDIFMADYGPLGTINCRFV